MMRKIALLTAIVGAVVIGAVGGLTAADAGSDDAPAETVEIDGVTVYVTAQPDGERPMYTLQPVSEAAAGSAAEASLPDSGPWATTGDVDACNVEAARPGAIDPGCALMLAMDAAGDLHPADAPATLVRTVCDEEVDPGEILDCEGRVITEEEARIAQAELRADLGAGE